MKTWCLVILSVCVFYFGCSRSANPSDNQSGKTMSGRYHSGENFSFELDLNADAGYQWFYSLSDTDVAKVDSVGYRPYSGNYNQVGGLTIETFYCSAMQRGTSTINLRELRGWEKDILPIDSLLYIVSVR